MKGACPHTLSLCHHRTYGHDVIFLIVTSSHVCLRKRVCLYFPSGSSLGDPHITSMDGLKYTCNGWGEYVFVQGNGLTIQARTALVQTTSGTPTATLFSAFAARQDQSDKVMVALNGQALGRTCHHSLFFLILISEHSARDPLWSSNVTGGIIEMYVSDMC